MQDEQAHTAEGSSPDADESAFRDVEFEAEDNEAKTSFGGSPDAADEAASKKVAKLREEIAQLRKEKQEYLDGWQRAKADYVNALKRFDEEKKGERERGVAKAVETLLPAFDALERAKEHGELPEGFQAIAKQLEGAFASLGLEAVGEVGEAFDPATHEALGQDKVEQADLDDKVTAVLEKGYRLGDRVIRPAKVRVGHFE